MNNPLPNLYQEKFVLLFLSKTNSKPSIQMGYKDFQY